jgi:methylphosphotriester-DNA--protein-cysteine methyltransferase
MASSPDGAPVTRSELRAELDALKTEFREQLQETVTQIRDYIDERTRDMQTELLRGFAGFVDSVSIRFRKLEADLSNVDAGATQRLGQIERQMADLTMRVMSLESQRPHPPQ